VPLDHRVSLDLLELQVLLDQKVPRVTKAIWGCKGLKVLQVLLVPQAQRVIRVIKEILDRRVLKV
jgi:hypothetical protein